MIPEMTLEEISDYYYKKYDTNLGYVMLFNDAIVVCDPRCNDLSKPGFALAYNFTNNAIKCTKIDSIWPLIFDDVSRIIKVDEVKDEITFIDFIGSIDKYCKEYNCDYETALDNKSTLAICVKSPYNPGQVIIYDKVNKQIKFSEGCKSYTLALIETLKNFIDKKDNFAEFAKESFEFCKENGCSFEDYAKEIAFNINIIRLKFAMNRFCNYHNSRKKLLYTFFDKDSKTGFAYYDDNTIVASKIINNKPYYVEIGKLLNSINIEKFKAFIKDGGTDIDRIVNKKLEEYKKQELERIKNANGDFNKSASEVKMNGKPKRTNRGI